MKQNELFKPTIIAIVIHFLLAITFLKLPIFKEIFLSKLVIETTTIAGTSFVFGYLGGGDVSFTTTNTGATFLTSSSTIFCITN